ncbi:uncharacterized protein TM35_000222080 [Trypanosoma theileri]|uniref:Flagellar Member 7 n=1 Tax=Trypanosoma theileri TaxID=67003 RepID=A0A1X0NT93_9TRYP|nr:uncharacterized protein TM35_000222080 [Trypanosoma theileri]ORC87409.1 hypothetical protein TM35_000222080 [Trypanosoma theileri]
MRRETTFDPKAPLTGKETQRDAERMEFQALSLESNGKHMECLQLMEKALQIRCQVCASGDATPMSIGEACDAAERLVTKSNTYGVKSFKEDDYETASTLFGYALEMTGEDSFPLREVDDRRRYLRGVTLNNYGCMERRRGHFPDALAYMQRSMECTGEQSPVAFLNMSAVQTQLRLCEDAAESAMRALQNLGASPEDPSLLAVAHHNLAMALEPLDPTRALEEYQEALNLARNFIGNDSNTTVIIERNMTRFMQGRQRGRSLHGGELIALRSRTGSACSGRGSLHHGETKPTDTLLQSQGKPQPPCEDEDIFPHPFMNSAADTVVPRKVLVTRIYHPSISTRKSLLPPPRHSKPAATHTTGAHMYTQIPRDRHEGPAAHTKSPRAAAASRLPPMESRPRQGPPPTVPAHAIPSRTANNPQSMWGSPKPTRAGAAVPQGVRGAPEGNLAHIPPPSSNHAATTKSRTARSPTREEPSGRNSFFATAPTSGSPRKLVPVGGPSLPQSKSKSPAAMGSTNRGSTSLVNTVPKQSKPVQSVTRLTQPLKSSRTSFASAATAEAASLAPTAVSSSNKNVKPVQPPTRSNEPLKPSRTSFASAAASPAPTAASSSNKNVKPAQLPTRSTEQLKPYTSNVSTAAAAPAPTAASSSNKNEKPVQPPTRSTEPLKPSRTSFASAAASPALTAASSSNKNEKPVQPLTRSTGSIKSTSERPNTSSGRLRPGSSKGGAADHSKPLVTTIPSPGGTQYSANSNGQLMAPSTTSMKPASVSNDSSKRGAPNRSSKMESLEQVPPAEISVPTVANRRELKLPRGAQGMNIVSYMADRLDMLMVDEDELDRKQLSASIIQRTFRSYLARKRLMEMREGRTIYNVLSEIREKIAVRKLQRWYRKSRHSRGRYGHMPKRSTQVLASERYKSAARIQAAARGWIARRRYARRKFFEKNSGHAALVVQCWWRQILAKRKMASLKKFYEEAKNLAAEKERREVAATIIQSRWRTRKAERLTRAERMRAKELRRKKAEALRLSAARTIQTWWRLLSARAVLRQLREAQAAREARLKEHQRKVDAATKLQSFGRMIIAKNETEPLLTGFRANVARRIRERCAENQAASKIQRAFRCYYAKRLLKRLRRQRREMKQQARQSALVAVAQRVGRGFLTRRDLGQILQNLENEAREFSQRKLALERADDTAKPILTSEQEKPELIQEDCRGTTVTEEMRTPPSMVPRLPVDDKQDSTEFLNKGELESHKIEDAVEQDHAEISRTLEQEVEDEKQRLSALEANLSADEKIDEREKLLELNKEKERLNVLDESERISALSTAISTLKREDDASKGERIEDAVDQDHAEISRTLEQEVEDEKQRLSALEANLSADEKMYERERLLELNKEKERLNILYESERISALSTAISTLEQEEDDRQSLIDDASDEEKIEDAMDQEHSETSSTSREEVAEEEQRLSVLEEAVSSIEEVEEEQRLDALREVLDHEDQKACEDQQSDRTLYTENHDSEEEATGDVPTQLASTLTPSEGKSDESLEALLEVEREKRRSQMELEKRLRKARDALDAKANEYRLRKIAAAESAQELKMLIPRPPLGRVRLQKQQDTELIESPESPTAANIREQQQQLVLNNTRKKEKAALDITRLARGYLDRKYTRALKVVIAEYIDHRVDMDSEEPPCFDNEFLQKFTEMYQSGVEKARAIRHITLIQTFMRAAESRMIVSARAPSSWSHGKDPSILSSRRNEAAETLCGFARIIQAKKRRILLQEMAAIQLQETRELEAFDTLRGFLYMIRAKKELAARAAAVDNHLLQEETLYAQDCAANQIACFFRAAAAKNEVRRRQEAIKEKLNVANAVETIVSFLRQCCAKREINRRRALVEQQRKVDIELEMILDLAAMRVQRAYRSYKARQLAREQRAAKKQRWGTIQAQDEEITAAMAAIAADAPNEAELWAKLGFCADENENENDGENENEEDLEVEALLYCVVQVQRVVRGWLARRKVQKLRSMVQQKLKEEEKEEKQE